MGKTVQVAFRLPSELVTWLREQDNQTAVVVAALERTRDRVGGSTPPESGDAPRMTVQPTFHNGVPPGGELEGDSPEPQETVYVRDPEISDEEPQGYAEKVAWLRGHTRGHPRGHGCPHCLLLSRLTRGGR